MKKTLIFNDAALISSHFEKTVIISENTQLPSEPEVPYTLKKKLYMIVQAIFVINFNLTGAFFSITPCHTSNNSIPILNHTRSSVIKVASPSSLSFSIQHETCLRPQPECCWVVYLYLSVIITKCRANIVSIVSVFCLILSLPTRSHVNLPLCNFKNILDHFSHGILYHLWGHASSADLS